MRQALKVFDGMTDELPIGKHAFIDYVLIFRDKQYYIWEVKNVRSHIDLASNGP